MTSLTTIVDIVDNLPPEPRLLSTWLRVLPRDADETLVEQVTAEVVRLVGFVQDYDHGLRRSAARARGGDAGAWFDVAAAFGAAVTLAVAVARPERSCHGPIDAFSDDVACSALWLAARAGQHYGYVAMLAIAVHLEDSRWTADMAGPDVFSSLSRAECLAGLAACLPMAFARDQARVSLGLDESPPKDTRVRRDQVADDHVLDVDCDIVELRERGSAVGRYRAAREGKMRNVLVDRPAKRPGDKPLPSEYRALETPLSLRRARSANSLATSLLAEFPWAEDLIDRLRADLVLSERLGRGHFQLRPTLIVGAPGSGKSRFAARLLDLTGVPGTVLSASGATDNRTLAGTGDDHGVAGLRQPGHHHRGNRQGRGIGRKRFPGPDAPDDDGTVDRPHIPGRGPGPRRGPVGGHVDHDMQPAGFG
jgi:hypothetical protein